MDFRVGKLLRFGPTRTSVNFDVYNLLNADTIRTVNNTYGGPTNTVWLRPASDGVNPAILLARIMKISVTLDF